ncbi:hypothetical protein ACLOJK_009894, partial [Asimina triloba]
QKDCWQASWQAGTQKAVDGDVINSAARPCPFMHARDYRSGDHINSYHDVATLIFWVVSICQAGHRF